MTTSSALVGSSRTRTRRARGVRPGHREALTLPTRQREAALTDRLLDAVPARQQVFAGGVEERAFQRGRVGVGRAQREVLAECPVDEPGMMAVDGHDVRAQRVQRQLARVDTAHEHADRARGSARANQEVGDRHRDLGILGDDTEDLAVGDVEREAPTAVRD